MSTPHVFTVEEWHQMGTRDAFGEDARVELLRHRREDVLTITALPHLQIPAAHVLGSPV